MMMEMLGNFNLMGLHVHKDMSRDMFMLSLKPKVNGSMRIGGTKKPVGGKIIPSEYSFVLIIQFILM
jgi:hypothetical protein